MFLLKMFRMGRFQGLQVVERPGGQPDIVEEPVNDFLQIEQFQDHGAFAPWL
jgi:hypothetical protein